MSTIPLVIVLGENKYSIDNINLSFECLPFHWFLTPLCVLSPKITFYSHYERTPCASQEQQRRGGLHHTRSIWWRNSKEGFKCRCRCKESTVRSDMSNESTCWLGARWRCGKCAPLVQGMRRCSRAGRALRQQKAPCETNIFRFNRKCKVDK